MYKRQPWDVLIDDGLHNIQDALDAGRRAVMFSQPWNASALVDDWLKGRPLVRVAGWGEVLEIL